MTIREFLAGLPSGLGVLMAGMLVACDTQTDIEVIDPAVPASARIGNIASADLQPVGGSNVSGVATFASLGDALRIDIEVMGLTGARHGVHLHEIGDCSAPDASSAGGHFSPDDDPHGAPTSPPAEHHAGDLGNMTAAPDGTAQLVLEDAELALVGKYGVIGRAVIIHQRADDLTTQPSGDAGDRVACGVIEVGPAVGVEQ